LPDHIKATQSERFISELGWIIGGLGLKITVVLTASSLLLFASNTAIIGSYHVFLALARQGFLPKILELRNRAFNTPHIAVLIATPVPALLILLTKGNCSSSATCMPSACSARFSSRLSVWTKFAGDWGAGILVFGLES
jgi:amino acid transporter